MLKVSNMNQIYPFYHWIFPVYSFSLLKEIHPSCGCFPFRQYIVITELFVYITKISIEMLLLWSGSINERIVGGHSQRFLLKYSFVHTLISKGTFTRSDTKAIDILRFLLLSTPLIAVIVMSNAFNTFTVTTSACSREERQTVGVIDFKGTSLEGIMIDLIEGSSHLVYLSI